MKEKKTVPFNGTKEQEEKLLGVIEKYKETKGALIPVLHEGQEILHTAYCERSKF